MRTPWAMLYATDSETYAPLQRGTLVNINLTNKTNKPMIVTNVLLRFDWMGTYRYLTECNVKIKPGESEDLPDVRFAVNLGVSVGSHKFEPGVSSKLLEDGKWVSQNETYVGRGDFIEVKPLPPKDFKVFVSHSNAPTDAKLVGACRASMRTCGLTGYFAEDDTKPGFKLWDKIVREIMLSDAFLVLWTKSAAESGDVREEIGIAIGSKKQDRMVPVVEKGVEVSGSLKSRGIEWVDYAEPNASEALSKALETMMDWAVDKEARKERMQRMREQREHSGTGASR